MFAVEQEGAPAGIIELIVDQRFGCVCTVGVVDLLGDAVVRYRLGRKGFVVEDRVVKQGADGRIGLAGGFLLDVVVSHGAPRGHLLHPRCAAGHLVGRLLETHECGQAHGPLGGLANLHAQVGIACEDDHRAECDGRRDVRPVRRGRCLIRCGEVRHKQPAEHGKEGRHDAVPAPWKLRHAQPCTQQRQPPEGRGQLQRKEDGRQRRRGVEGQLPAQPPRALPLHNQPQHAQQQRRCANLKTDSVGGAGLAHAEAPLCAEELMQVDKVVAVVVAPGKPLIHKHIFLLEEGGDPEGGAQPQPCRKARNRPARAARGRTQPRADSGPFTCGD